MRVEPAVPADVLAAIRAPLAASGASPISSPMLQPLGSVLEVAGEAIRSRLFVVQSQAGEEMCLRPDFTLAVAREHVAGKGRTTAGAYLYEGPCFRAAPAEGGFDEFVQLGVERFNLPADRPEPDAEIATLAWRAACAGGRDDLTLWLGDMSLFSAFIDNLGLEEARAEYLWRMASRPRALEAELARAGQISVADKPGLGTLLSGLSEADAASVLDDALSLAGVTQVGGRGSAEIAARLRRRAAINATPPLTENQARAVRSFLAIDARPAEALMSVRSLAGEPNAFLRSVLDQWADRLEKLDVPIDRLRLMPALGHAFEYYDGFTFEVRSSALGADRPVAVGGRYDLLMDRLSGTTASTAVGCMVRPWRAYSGGEA